jgi:hypothetical protein
MCYFLIICLSCYLQRLCIKIILHSLFRLSQLAGAKLTEGNPNIADLSDKNRPINLAEKFSELYDNEWTDALEEQMETGNKSEEEGIGILLDIVKVMCLYLKSHFPFPIKKFDRRSFIHYSLVSLFSKYRSHDFY